VDFVKDSKFNVAEPIAMINMLFQAQQPTRRTMADKDVDFYNN
jgi:hypothetical protein